MTVEALTTFSGPYTGTGAADQEFAVTFHSAGEDEILVTLDGEDVASGYTFTRDTDGRGTVTATLTGEVYIYSAPSFAQETDFQRQGPYFPDDLNAPLDRAAIRDLFLKNKIDILWPALARLADDRAGLYLAWDADGDPIVSAGTGTDAGLRTDLAAVTGATLVKTSDGTTVEARLAALDAGGALGFTTLDVADTVDIADAAEEILETSDLYIPEGTDWFTSRPIVVPGNRRVFGAGIGRTTIKRTANCETIFVLALDDRSDAYGDFAARSVDNVEIAYMTLDFNFDAGWKEYKSCIKYWADNDSLFTLDNNEIHHIEFIDSAEEPHPDLAALPGGDAWCIDCSAYNRTGRRNNRIHHVFSPEGHQLVANGGTGGLHNVIEDFYCYHPHANAISQSTLLTAAYHANYKFVATLIRRGFIDGPYAAGVWIGPDGGQAAGVGGGTMMGCELEDITIRFDDYTVGDFASGFFFRPFETLNERLAVRRCKTLKTSDVTAEITDFNIETTDFSRAAIATTSSFVQPAMDGTVQIALTSAANIYAGGYLQIRSTANQTSGSLIVGNSYVIEVSSGGLDMTNVGAPDNAVNTTFEATGTTPTDWGTGTLGRMDGGIYKIVSKDSSLLATVQAKDWFIHSVAAATVPTAATVTFLGGFIDKLDLIDNDFRAGTTRLTQIVGGKARGNDFGAVTVTRLPLYRLVGNDMSSLVLSNDLNVVVARNDFMNPDDSGAVGLINMAQTIAGSWAGKATGFIGYNNIVDFRDTSKLFKAMLNSSVGGIVDMRAFLNFVPVSTTDYEDGTMRSYGNIYGAGGLEANKGAPQGFEIYNSASLNFDLTAVEFHDLTITVTGARDGDEVEVTTTAAFWATATIASVSGFVSANDTVTVRVTRAAGTTPNPAAAVFQATVRRKAIA